MPCDGKYMEPRFEEALSKETAILIIYVNKMLSKHTPDWIVKAADDTYGNEARVDELVAFLCELCTNMTKKQQDTIIYDGRNPQARKLANWWEEHQKADKLRKMEEEKEKKRQKVLKKLTKEERELLGLS